MSEIRTFNPDFRQTIEDKLTRQHFMQLMGFEITEILEGRIRGELIVDRQHKQQKGFVHGGVIATMADIVAGFAAVSLVRKGDQVVTAEIKISYYHPGVGNKLFAEGWVEKQGRKLNFCEAEVYEITEGKRKIIAKATTTMATITAEEIEKAKK